MKIGYIRVSTVAQNTDRQTDALSNAGCEKVFVDKISGARADRPQLNKMFEQLRAGDIVIVTELSRFGRSIKDLITFMERLNNMGVGFQSLKEPFLNTQTAQGRFVYTIFAALAEFDREIRRDSSMDGLAAARSRGRKGGRPPIEKKRLELAIRMYNSKDYSIKEIIEASQVSQGTLYRYIKK